LIWICARLVYKKKKVTGCGRKVKKNILWKNA
jgi:hypothetical protein